MSEQYTPSTDVIREGHAFYLQSKIAGATFGQGLAEFDRWLAEHDRQVAARTRREVLNALPLPDEDARSGMIHARALIAAHIIEQEWGSDE